MSLRRLIKQGIKADYLEKWLFVSIYRSYFKDIKLKDIKLNHESYFPAFIR